MLSRERIDRTDLYEAVWTQPLQHIAQTLEISDVALGKICTKLRVPVPGRGHWAKGPMARKLQHVPLYGLRPGQPEWHSISQPSRSAQEQAQLESEARLATMGIRIPTTASEPGPPPWEECLESSRPLLLTAGLDANSLRREKACVDITVSPDQTERALRIFQRLAEALKASGFILEVLPPDPQARTSWGAERPVSSKTGVLILDAFVTFSLEEDFTVVEIPPPPPPIPSQGKRRYQEPPFPPAKQYRKEGLGSLKLSILELSFWRGTRSSWRDGKRQRVEDCLDSFLKSVFELAEREHARTQTRKREEQEEKARRQRAEAEEKRQVLRARRVFDLGSRLQDCLEAEQVRTFVAKVKALRLQGGYPESAGPDLDKWMLWAEALADELEGDALQGVLKLRTPPESSSSNSFSPSTWREQQLMREVELWQRRFIYGRR